MIERRWILALGVVALVAPALGLIPPAGDTALLLGGWLLAALVVVGLAATKDKPSRWRTLVAPQCYVLAVVLLRQAHDGAASGFAPLLLLPLAWVALVGDRASMVVLNVAMGVGLIGPILAVGAPDYPTSEWRRAIIWLVVAPTMGLAIQAIVERVRQANSDLEALARRDPLTGLFNRRGFAELADREIVRARRTNEPLAVAMIDLDHFKRFNDTHGHAGGDRLLTQAALAWGEELRDIDLMARWGGEEFIILLPRCPIQVGEIVADRVRVATPEQQTCSVGVAQWRPTESLTDAIGRADEALYRAKERGRDQVALDV